MLTEIGVMKKAEFPAVERPPEATVADDEIDL